MKCFYVAGHSLGVRFVSIFVPIFLCCCNFYAQTTPAQVEPAGKSLYHQIFLDKPVERIIELKYENSDKLIDYELNVERTSIILKNYDGQSRVQVTVVYQSGSTDSFSRSKCFVNDYIPES